MTEITNVDQWAVLFDWDGVVVDSREAHFEAFSALAQRLDRTFGEVEFRATFGLRNEEIFKLLRWVEPGADDHLAALAVEKESAYRDAIRASGIQLVPGIEVLLEALGQAGVPRIVCTSTPRINVDCVFEISCLGSSFEDVVAAEDVIRGKPAPDVFLAGAKLAGLKPGRCIVLEDAPAGLRAGRAAGCRTVAVATTQNVEVLQAETPDDAIADHRELTLARLQALLV